MSAATVAEPFLLSSYPESAASRKRKSVPLFASLPSGSNADPYVSVAVQGDGIHVLDTSTLHPAVSHTLGPSASFSCPPASRTSQAKGGPHTCKTFAVIESGPDILPEGKGKTIAVWEEGVAGNLSTNSAKSKRSALTSYPIAHVYAPDFLPAREIVVGVAGEVSIASEDLRILHTYIPPSTQPSTLRKHFLFRATSCAFLPQPIASDYQAVSLSFLQSAEVLKLSVVGLEGESLHPLGECIVSADIEPLDISCSTSGFISVILPSGTWQSFSISTSGSSSLSVSPGPDSLRLQGLTFINTSRTSEVALAALTSSHVLLCAVTSGSPIEIILLLWDLRYGVLLAQQAISVPSTLPRPKKDGAIVHLEVSPTTSASKCGSVNMNALLTLLPHPERELVAESGSAPARSSILLVPLTVPAVSTIAAAMGKANTGVRWVSTKLGPQAPGQNVRGLPELSADARKTLREIRAGVDASANGGTTAAETTFFEYVQQQGKGRDATEEDRLPMEYPFVQGVLEAVLRAPSGTQGNSAPLQGKGQVPATYSQKIVKFLLDNRSVSSSMVEGGVLPALAARSDWDAVSLAMAMVTDIPETDILALLSQVVTVHRHRQATTDENTMQVDAAPPPSVCPSVPAFLARCVAYPSTPASQRTAFRKHLNDAEDIGVILETLDGWIVRHTKDEALLAVSDTTGNSADDVPPLDRVLSFLQTLLDASLLVLLAHAPAHRLLRSLVAHVEPALTQTNELELLCGPLEPFARAAAAKVKAQTEGKEGMKADSGKDWRRKRKLAHEQAGMAIGLYQLEELVL